MAFVVEGIWMEESRQVESTREPQRNEWKEMTPVHKDLKVDSDQTSRLGRVGPTQHGPSGLWARTMPCRPNPFAL